MGLGQVQEKSNEDDYQQGMLVTDYTLFRALAALADQVMLTSHARGTGRGRGREGCAL